ncbi:hypothetical protein Dimus_014864 [Dionaea muscipula]
MSSINGSAPNHPDSNGRSFATSFSAQSGAVFPGFHHTGTIQGLHSVHGSFNQPTGNLPSGRFASTNLTVALSQISYGHSGITNRGGLGVQGPNRLMSGVLQQGLPQVISMLGNSYRSAGGPLSHGHVQAVNNLSSMAMLNDVDSNDSSPFDINDFPQLTSRPSSAGGPQGQLGSIRKQGLGVSSVGQENLEFSMQNEDFPALPGFKGQAISFHASAWDGFF